MQHRLAASVIAMMVLSAPLLAQPYSLTETFAKDGQYHVECKVVLNGTLLVPAVDAKGLPTKEAPKALTLNGNSTIAYDERILQLNNDRRVERTVRAYRQLEFNRTVGQDVQQSKLRPEAMRLVILRHNQYEVPFGPTTPLLWSEIELVRTDVFVPALAGLLPTEPQTVGAKWKADKVAIQELTDLERLDFANLECTFLEITKYNNRDCAVITFNGTVDGVGEDGNARHELKGGLYFDLAARYVPFLRVKAAHTMLDKDKKNSLGKIEGTLEITRKAPQTQNVSNAALSGLKLDPDADNTLLLFDHPPTGTSFLYPRNWRIVGFNEKQIAVDERRGSGLLITLGTTAATPKTDQFHKDTHEWLGKQQNVKRLRADAPRSLQPGLDAFSFDTEFGKDRVFLQYYAVRQGNNAATVAGRFTTNDIQAVHAEGERLMRSLQLRSK